MRRRDFLKLAGGVAIAAALPVGCAATRRGRGVKTRAAMYAGFDGTIPFERAIPMIRQVGFEVVSLSAKHSGYDTVAGRTTIEKLIEKHGITIDSLHAPFPEGDQMFSLNETKRLESIRQCKTAIDAARQLDGRIVVVHLIQPYDLPHDEKRDQMIVQGMESIKAIAAYAADKGVKLALENGQRRDYDQVLERCLSEFSGDSVGFCYDSGHENVQGTCFKMLEKFGNRLLTTHIHDNLGSDTHMLPYEGNINWNKFREVFHRLEYRGSLQMEAMIENSHFKDPMIFLSEARKCAEKLLEPPDVLRA